MRRGRVVQLWFLVIHRPRNTRLRLHDLSFFTRDTRTKRTLVSKTWWIVHRLPSPNDLPAPRRERGPTWPLLNATLDLSRVYLPTYLPTYLPCICLYPYINPFFSRFRGPMEGKKAGERERGRREEDLYAQWQPVIPVAATGSALLVYFVESSLVAKESIHEKWW